MYERLHRHGVIHSVGGQRRWALAHGGQVARLVDFSNARFSRGLHMPVPEHFEQYGLSQEEFERYAAEEYDSVLRRLGMVPW
jgi:hypothetical protein